MLDEKEHINIKIVEEGLIASVTLPIRKRLRTL